jgi:hypothetical protein
MKRRKEVTVADMVRQFIMKAKRTSLGKVIKFRRLRTR